MEQRFTCNKKKHTNYKTVNLQTKDNENNKN